MVCSSLFQYVAFLGGYFLSGITVELTGARALLLFFTVF